MYQAEAVEMREPSIDIADTLVVVERSRIMIYTVGESLVIFCEAYTSNVAVFGQAAFVFGDIWMWVILEYLTSSDLPQEVPASRL